jgi:uncharacterized protein YfaS (alpha-2-macroglobulin family)
MEKSVSNYTFKHIGQSSEIDFSKSVIWVMYADKIPPHIGFSSNNSFFSLKVSGKDEGLNANNVLELIQRKRIPTLLIQLMDFYSLEDVKSEYDSFKSAVFGSITCLNPIRNILNQPEATQLSDLLNRIEDNIQRIGSLNLSDNYKALPSYSPKEIHSYIKQLSNHVGR